MLRHLTSRHLNRREGDHELTAADVRAYADAKALADAQLAGARKAPRRRPGAQAET
jgi:hypothetical protein